ncbi:hypothetical protein PS15p_211637 [Mucor circinelloides]
MQQLSVICCLQGEPIGIDTMVNKIKGELLIKQNLRHSSMIKRVHYTDKNASNFNSGSFSLESLTLALDLMTDYVMKSFTFWLRCIQSNDVGHECNSLSGCI